MAMPLQLNIAVNQDVEMDSENSSDANQSAFYESEVDTDDEFQARLAEAYKHHSPSRQRRLAKSGQASPTNQTHHFMMPPPQVPYQVLAPPSACVFPPPAQLPLLPGKARVAVPAPPVGVPRLSQVFGPGAPPAHQASNPEEAKWSWHSVDVTARRDSDSSSVEDIRGVDLKIRQSSEAKQSWASTQAPSTPCSDSGQEDHAESDKPAAGSADVTPQASLANAARRSEKAGKDAKAKQAKPAKPAHADDQAEATDEEAMASWPAGVTTLMIRQLPRNCTHLAFLEEVARRGFKGLFDFIYFPYDLKKGSNVGFGFINFLTAECAAAFVRDFDGLYLDEHMRAARKPLRIHPASVQGYEANLACFSKNKSVTKRDSSFSPLFLPGGSWASLENSTDQSAQDASRPRASASPEAPAAPAAKRKAEAVAGAVLPAPGAAAKQDPYSTMGMACPVAAAQFPPPGHAQPPAAGQMPTVPGADQDPYQWMSLEEEKLKLLQELASVQESQRALASTMMTMPVASPQPR